MKDFIFNLANLETPFIDTIEKPMSDGHQFSLCPFRMIPISSEYEWENATVLKLRNCQVDSISACCAEVVVVIIIRQRKTIHLQDETNSLVSWVRYSGENRLTGSALLNLGFENDFQKLTGTNDGRTD